MASPADLQHRCPSYAADHADSVVGVVGPGGAIGFLTPPVPVTGDLLASLRAANPATPLEMRFRFSGTCQEAGCSNWRTDDVDHDGQRPAGRCGVVEDVLAGATSPEAATPVSLGRPLPHCGIRSDCRWWAQRGRDACMVCPYVQTASLDDATLIAR